MGLMKRCEACGEVNPEQTHYCEHCGSALQADAAVATPEPKAAFCSSRHPLWRWVYGEAPEPKASFYPSTDSYASSTDDYASTYRTMRATAKFISAVGWIVTAVSAVMLLGGLSQGGIGALFILPAFGGAIGGLLLVGVGQFNRATVDTADFTGEMLAIMKASQRPGKQP